MHPARAYEIRQSAERLISQYSWNAFAPVILSQQTDGHVSGSSRMNSMPEEAEVDSATADRLPEGTITTFVEVLCQLSQTHGVDWDICDDYEPDSIGCIRDGIAEAKLLEQLEMLSRLGELLEESDEEEEIGEHQEDDRGWEEEGPILLKFPTGE